MADDIDDLLDEVEARFVKKADKLKNADKPKTVSSSHKPRSSLKEDDLNSIMDEICDIPEPDSQPRQCSSSPYTALPAGDSKRRCFQVYLAGSSLPGGITTTAHQRACDTLRCTDCDFRISVYKDFMWDSSVDYLFLRNNMPEFSRLKSKLTRKPGYKAYACQCKCRSIDKLTELSEEKELKWVCGKHT